MRKVSFRSHLTCFFLTRSTQQVFSQGNQEEEWKSIVKIIVRINSVERWWRKEMEKREKNFHRSPWRKPKNLCFTFLPSPQNLLTEKRIKKLHRTIARLIQLCCNFQFDFVGVSSTCVWRLKIAVSPSFLFARFSKFCCVNSPLRGMISRNDVKPKTTKKKTRAGLTNRLKG